VVVSTDAKPLTTAEVVTWVPHLDEDGGACTCILVERDDLLATTRALECEARAHRALEFGAAALAERAEKAEAQVAVSGGEWCAQNRAEWRGPCGACAWCVKQERERAEKAERERDEARAEVARRDALLRSDGYEEMRQHAADLAQRLEKRSRLVSACEWEVREAHSRAVNAEKALGAVRERAEKAEHDVAAERALRVSALEEVERLRAECAALGLRAEKAEAELLSVHDALHRECDGTANLPNEIRALRAERDDARRRATEWQALAEAVSADVDRLVAEKAGLVAALEGCVEWMGDNPPANGWGCLDRGADADRHAAVGVAEAALAKAKGGG
jgi:hypothetical protein